MRWDTGIRRSASRLVSTRASLGVAVGVAAVTLAGCGQAENTASGGTTAKVAESDLAAIGGTKSSSPSSSSSPTSSKSSATSVSPTSTPSDPGKVPLDSKGKVIVPDAAKAHTQQGAVEFVKFYWKTLEQLSAHPRTGVLTQISTEGCRSCAMQEGLMADLSRVHGSVVSRASQHGPFRVKEDAGDQIIVQFTTRDSGSTRTEYGRTKSLPPAHLEVSARADWMNGKWLMGETGADPK